MRTLVEIRSLGSFVEHGNMLLKTFLASLVVAAATASSAVAYTGIIPNLPHLPERCIVGEECFDACFIDRSGVEHCQTFCQLVLGPCPPIDDGGGLDDCDETGDADNPPDYCPDEGIAP